MSSPSWRVFLRHLKERGLAGVQWIVSDKDLVWSKSLHLAAKPVWKSGWPPGGCWGVPLVAAPQMTSRSSSRGCSTWSASRRGSVIGGSGQCCATKGGGSIASGCGACGAGKDWKYREDSESSGGGGRARTPVIVVGRYTRTASGTW